MTLARRCIPVCPDHLLLPAHNAGAHEHRQSARSVAASAPKILCGTSCTCRHARSGRCARTCDTAAVEGKMSCSSCVVSHTLSAKCCTMSSTLRARAADATSAPGGFYTVTAAHSRWRAHGATGAAPTQSGFLTLSFVSRVFDGFLHVVDELRVLIHVLCRYLNRTQGRKTT